MKKRTIKIGLVFTLLVVLMCLIYVKLNTDIESILSKPKVDLIEEVGDDGELSLAIHELEPVSLEVEFPMDMNESMMRHSIHLLSHQKVIADKKWGMIPMTNERIHRLIDVLEMNKSQYTNADVYEGILNRWALGDFSTVDLDHNIIWTLQGGTIGRATGILSHEEEKKFIAEHYSIE